ncbi:MAG: Fic family protein [Candidatus Pacebacteria bacterium]|nr:Fic family protein [Candidatus Paceibacterota bacterium]
MIKLNSKQQKIVAIFIEKGNMQSSAILEELVKLGEEMSLVTVKRALSEMVNLGILAVNGSGRSVSYDVSMIGRIFFEVDAHAYCSIDPDKRYGLRQYNFDLFASIPNNIFNDNELKNLESVTTKYKLRARDLSATIQKKELERFIIELSWKSSKIEGNTYTLLDTEKLILENKKADGKTEQETQMILNHKDAFSFIYKNTEQFKTITKKNLEELHAILIKDLGVDEGLRKNMVGITGSIYRPLDNVYQINDAIEALISTISRMPNPYAKAFMALIGISYIQPFGDGNKRTGRLMANAILLAYGLPPLSYCSVEESEYREAILSFYELNSIMPIKKIFINQYDFTAQNYTIV